MGRTMPLRAATGSIILVEYDPAWPRLFEEERARLIEAIGEWAADIQHVGSTSIPGIAAKPIIDIGVALRSLGNALKCISPLVEIGYECPGEYGISGRIYFRKRTEAPLPGQSHNGVARTHQLHMYESSHPEWGSHITFRDYLRAHPQTARQYETLKRELAVKHAPDVEAYANAKCDFVRGVLLSAGFDVSRKRWSDEPGGVPG